ncbi:hypothetical protein D3C87_1523170 [compost metagenome]
MFDQGLGRCRFLLHDIQQCHGHYPGLQGPKQSIGIDDATSRGIDQGRTVLHPRKSRIVHQMPSVRIKRQM